MTVLDLIGSRAEVYSIHSDMSVHDAARYLRDRQVRAVAVVDDQGRPLGVVSQSDVSDKVAAENRCPGCMHVSQIMSTSLVSVSSAESLETCRHRMEANNLFHLLVIDPGGFYRGMVSVRDLLSVIALDEKARADMLDAFVMEGRQH